MAQTPKNKTIKILISAICGVLSFFVDFVIIPQTVALPDPIWVALMLLLPMFIAICLMGRNMEIHPMYVLGGLPVQYLFLFIFAEQISKNFGINLSKGLSGLEYAYTAVVWPFGITLTQFLTLVVLRWKRRNR